MLIYKLNRLGRNARHIQNAIYMLEEMGVRVVSINEQFDTRQAMGRAMVGFLGTLAELERDMTVEHSVEATNRLARDGVWLGGIVPYGYRVEGQDKHARLVISAQHIPGLNLSEADVIRLIYERTGNENWPCQRVADYLNALGIPPAYVRDNREPLHGKRKSATQGIWRAGRIRNMVVNPTYKGIHRYGARSKKVREVIEREVPAIINVELWDCAQTALQSRMFLSKKNATQVYLLRGLIKCGVCGLGYCGTRWHAYRGGSATWYKCNGATNHRGIYGAQGQRCPSKGSAATY